MGQSLEKRVLKVQSAVSRLRILYALARFVAVVFACVLVLGLADYGLRVENPLVRWAATLMALAAVLLAYLKWVFPSLAFDREIVATARRIERHFPEFNERLSSAIAFASVPATDAAAGSLSLRHNVLAEAEAISTGLDFGIAIDLRPATRAVFTAAIIVGLTALIAASNYSLASLAVARLVQPWRELDWPRRHQLAFVDAPSRIGKGSDFHITLIDQRGRLPANTEILMRYETPPGWRIDTKSLKPVGERVMYLQSNVTQGFEYRARGGDDNTMPWKKLEVVEPPKITDLEVEVQSPAYSGQEPHSQGRIVTALSGSQLRVFGRLDNPVRSVIVYAEPANDGAPDTQISVDGQSFTAPASDLPWTVQESGSIRIAIVDEHGLTHAQVETIEIHAVPDHSPSITWELPLSHSEVSAGAKIRIKAAVKDDLAISSVKLSFQRLKVDKEETIDLGSNDVADRSIDCWWTLSSVKDLKPGDEVVLWLSAEDSKGQMTISTVRRLTVISDKQLTERIAVDQGDILSGLIYASRLAHKARDKTRSLQSRLESVGEVTAEDLASLQAAIYQHRQLERELAKTPAGLAGQIAKLLDEIATNNVDGQSTTRSLNEIAERLQDLNEGLLPGIDRELTESSKTKAREEVVARLNRAAVQQDHVIGVLEDIIGQMAVSDAVTRIAQHVEQIREDQEQLAAETDQLKLKTIIADSDTLQANQTAAQQQSAQQLDLARRFDKLQAGLQESALQIENNDPTAKEIKTALDIARRLSLGSRMREAASRLSQNQLSEAQRLEQEVLKGLQQLTMALWPSNSINGQAADAGTQGQSGSRRGQLGSAGTQPGAGTGDPIVGPSRSGPSGIEFGPTSSNRAVDPKQVVGRLWGHLPDRLRHEMQSSFSEQFLPQYERLIEDYYKRLAEERSPMQ
jgi:hypothetical protein